MPTDPIPITPGMLQPRGEFPEHGPGPDRVRVRTRAEAREYALARLAAWREAHPDGD